MAANPIPSRFRHCTDKVAIALQATDGYACPCGAKLTTIQIVRDEITALGWCEVKSEPTPDLHTLIAAVVEAKRVRDEAEAANHQAYVADVCASQAHGRASQAFTAACTVYVNACKALMDSGSKGAQ